MNTIDREYVKQFFQCLVNDRGKKLLNSNQLEMVAEVCCRLMQGASENIAQYQVKKSKCFANCKYRQEVIQQDDKGNDLIKYRCLLSDKFPLVTEESYCEFDKKEVKNAKRKTKESSTN